MIFGGPWPTFYDHQLRPRQWRPQQLACPLATPGNGAENHPHVKVYGPPVTKKLKVGDHALKGESRNTPMAKERFPRTGGGRNTTRRQRPFRSILRLHAAHFRLPRFRFVRLW